MTFRRLSAALCLSLLIGAGALAAGPAAAEEFPATCGDLQAKLGAAQNGDVVTLAEGADCEGPFSLPANREITLQGGGPGGATLRGNGEGTQILRGSNVGHTTIRNLTFRAGSAEVGGAIQITGQSPVLLSNNRFFGNAAGDGGAVWIASQSIPFTAEGEIARAAGAGPALRLEDNVFGGEGALGNDAGSNGGALSLESDSPVELVNNRFLSNTAGGEGAGAHIRICQTTADLERNTFDGNTLRGGAERARRGAGLSISNPCDPSLDRSEPEAVASGRAEPEVRLEQLGNVFIRNVISGGGLPGKGGAGLSGDADGAGESIHALRTISTNDRFVLNKIQNTANDADGEGGGLAIADFLGFEGRNLVAAGNTIGDEGDGGGVYVSGDFGREFGLFDSTVTGNAVGADPGSGGSGVDGGSDERLTAYNTIIAGNSGGTDQIEGFEPDLGNVQARTAGIQPAARDIQASIVCEGTAAHPTGGGTDGVPNRCVDPNLVNPAQGDVHQKAESPSVDTGSDELVPSGLTTDFEAQARKNGRVDVGADEFFAPVVAQETATPTPTATPTASPAPTSTPAPKQEPARPLARPTPPCASLRAFRIRLRVPRGEKARSATVAVNGKRVDVLRGRRLRAAIVLRGLPRGTVTVRISIRLRSGRKVSGTRTYRTCRPGIRSGRPPRV